MGDAAVKHDGQCECGAVTLTITGPALLRAYCHCATCRDYNGSDEPADITVFRASDVTVGNEAGVEYRGYQKPALAQRGRCTSCDRPALERAKVPLMPPIVLVPSENVRSVDLLPPPSMHIFYDRRTRDVHDDLPKRGGFLTSQPAFMMALLRGLRRTRGADRITA